MAKIFSTPDEVQVPEFSFENIKDWQKDEEKFLNELRDWCHKHFKGKYVGKEVSFPHADGYARYMVASEKPFQLMHLPLGDAWHSPIVEHMTVKAIKEKIDQDEAWRKTWEGKENKLADTINNRLKNR